MNEAVQALRDMGKDFRPEDVARLSPLMYSNLNVLGRYSFDLSPEVARGELRQLRPFRRRD